MAHVEMRDHVITQEDLDNNPGLAEEGVVVGDTIEVPAANEEGSLEGWEIKEAAEEDGETEDGETEEAEEDSAADESAE